MTLDPRQKRGGAVLVTSLALHALFALALTRVPAAPPRPPSPAPSSLPAELDWIPTEDVTPPAPRSEGTTTPPEPAPLARSSVSSSSRAVGSPVAPPHEPSAHEPSAHEPSAHEPGAPPTGDPSPAASAAAAPPSLAALGVGKNPFLPGRGEGPAPSADAPPKDDRAEAKARVEASLRSAAREREAELGLGPEGPVRDALGAAMYESNAPVIGRVVFSISADASGHVLSVETVSADRTLADYAGMLAIARKKLAATVLRLPSSAKGAELRIEVASAWKLPSGRDPGIALSVLGGKVTKGEGKASTQVQILPLPRLLCSESADPTSGVKMPTCVVSAPIVATDGDPADIGAKARRIVATKVVSRTIL